MPTKRIQLRGISRTPSDRMVEDGGCAESLNMQTDFSELAPNVKPKDLTKDPDCWEKYGLPPAGAYIYDIKYIHKGNNYRNFICAMGKQIFVWKKEEAYVAYLDNVDDEQVLADHAGRIAALVNTELADGQMNLTQRMWLINQLERFSAHKPVELWGEFTSVADAETRIENLQAALALESFTLECDFRAAVEAYYDHNIFVELGNDEELQEITSIGNTLIISSTKNVYYVLYKDGEYKFLGNDIPVPHLEFRTEDDDEQEWEEPIETPVTFGMSQEWYNSVMETESEEDPSYYKAWRIGRELRIKDGSALAAWDRIIDRIQKSISVLVARAYDNIDFLAPVLLRYGVRLYDGTYKHVSAPVLVSNDLAHSLAPASRRKVFTEGQVGVIAGTYMLRVISGTATLGTGYKIYFSGSLNLADWDDIISSIDIFSVEYLFEAPNGESVEYVTNHEVTPSSQAEFLTKTEWDNAEKDYLTLRKEQILSKGPFFRIARIEKKDIVNGVIPETVLKAVSQDYLLTQNTLKDSGEASSLVSFKKSYTYNSRLILSNIKERLYAGPDIFSSIDKITGGYNDVYSSFFYINTDCGELRIVQGMNNLTLGSAYDIGNYIAYPNSKCFKAEVYRAVSGGTWMRKTFTMEEHPLWINCAFSVESVDWDEWEQVSALPVVNDTIESDNRIIVSEVANPFSFPLVAANTFGSKILGFAAATTALSTGQFGQFPLYVFTAEGIEALQVASDGTFVSHHPVAREVAIEGSITQIDQAIIFTTERSVMMLSGSEVTDIAPYMNGRHYVLEPEVASLLQANSKWEDLVLTDTTPFMTFMREARAIYDYIGKRLIFASRINELLDYYPYMYAYKLDTQTWHKVTLVGNIWETKLHVTSVLNSYPEAFVQVNTEFGYTRLYDFSNAIDVLDPESSRGLVATRILNFEQPDIYKTIKCLRIRGNYLPERIEDGATVKTCQYILLGSNDGINFHILHSLRGQSWKFFRIVLLTDFMPTDRIAYIELEWEPRFTNKMR